MATSLRHPFHPEHDLILLELSENCRVECRVCESEFSGQTYCCRGCNIFLHKLCAELPLQIEHPSHPHHPSLSLKLKSRRGAKNDVIYQCDACSYNIHFRSAVATVYPTEEEATIQHFSHDHPLTSFYLNALINFLCRLCKGEISGGLFYGCPLCSFHIHESCARLPRAIVRHPFHPQHSLTFQLLRELVHCSFCERRIVNLAFRCDECVFYLGFCCASLAWPPENQLGEDGLGTIQHFSHEHQLASFSMKMVCTDIRCKVCNLGISGEAYGCPDCRFFLHRSCLQELPQQIVHFLHPDHPLVFRAKSQYGSGRFGCNSCMMESDGFVFTCEMCNFDLDTVCALETFSAFKEGAATEIQHFSHRHPLTLRYCRKTDKWQSCACIVCGASTVGLVAYCCHTCRYSGSSWLHRSCRELPQKLEHPFHTPHHLTLQSDRDFVCAAYHSHNTGFAYCCDECEFFLSVRAASLKPTLKHPPHEHDLTHFEQIDSNEHCNYCGKRCRVDLYRCVPCNFNVHHACVTLLPLTIKHDCHFHSVTLRDKVVDPCHDEEYCDACETTRRPDHSVYYCEECPFAVHIGCVIPWVEIQGTKRAELKKVDGEIASVEAEIEEIEMMHTKLEALRLKLKELRVEKEYLALTGDD